MQKKHLKDFNQYALCDWEKGRDDDKKEYGKEECWAQQNNNNNLAFCILTAQLWEL